MSTTPFKDTMLYPILFMLVICIVFVGMLAVMYRSSEGKIESQKLDAYQKIVISLLADPLAEALEAKPLILINDYKATYESYVKEIKISGLDKRVFTAVVEDSVLAYCVDISGKGLWGTMRALIALSPDLKSLKGLAIYDQMETPGLGARIGEQWFLDQFSQIQVISMNGSTNGSSHDFELIPEGQKPANQYQIQQITGATITSVSVLKMLKNEIDLIYVAKQKQVQI